MAHEDDTAITDSYGFALGVAEALDTRQETLARARRAADAANDDQARERVTHQQAGLDRLRALAAEVGISTRQPGPYGLTAGRYSVLRELAWHVNRKHPDVGFHGIAWPTTRTLAALTGQGTRGVATCLKYLTAEGFITPAQTPDGQDGWRVADRATQWWVTVRTSAFLPAYVDLLREIKSKERLPEQLRGWDAVVIEDPEAALEHPVATPAEVVIDDGFVTTPPSPGPTQPLGALIAVPPPDDDPVDPDLADTRLREARVLVSERTRAAWADLEGAA